MRSDVPRHLEGDQGRGHVRGRPGTHEEGGREERGDDDGGDEGPAVHGDTRPAQSSRLFTDFSNSPALPGFHITVIWAPGIGATVMSWTQAEIRELKVNRY